MYRSLMLNFNEELGKSASPPRKPLLKYDNGNLCVRIEQEQHYYNAKHSALVQLGLEPNLLTESVLTKMIETAIVHRDNVDESKVMPNVKWKS